MNREWIFQNDVELKQLTAAAVIETELIETNSQKTCSALIQPKYQSIIDSSFNNLNWMDWNGQSKTFNFPIQPTKMGLNFFLFYYYYFFFFGWVFNTIVINKLRINNIKEWHFACLKMSTQESFMGLRGLGVKGSVSTSMAPASGMISPAQITTTKVKFF